MGVGMSPTRPAMSGELKRASRGVFGRVGTSGRAGGRMGEWAANVGGGGQWNVTVNSLPLRGLPMLSLKERISVVVWISLPLLFGIL